MRIKDLNEVNSPNISFSRILKNLPFLTRRCDKIIATYNKLGGKH